MMMTSFSRKDCVCSKFVEEDGKTFMMMTTEEETDVSEENGDDSEEDDLGEDSEDEFGSKSQVCFCIPNKYWNKIITLY